MRNIIIGNWKLHPQSLREARMLARSIAQIASRIKNVDIVIAPPFPFLPLISAGSKVAIAAQDVFWEREGPYTGEVSGPMLRGVGARYVIVGHSERRNHLHETDEIINKKLKHALLSGLRPILCVGERKRDSDGEFFSVIKQQIEIAFAKVKRGDVTRVVVAYEPVWAISSGKSAKDAEPADANEAALFIRKTIAGIYGVRVARGVRIIYGGSSNAKNAKDFLSEREISGLLVGRESRDAKEFIKIIECAYTVS
ncbi:MAG: triose-phosphate isomerase [Candidatus Ryanbacteria bacterium RIFCSPLOWO2_02_FULL_47_14]|uniref:Triosephosphate isomerase n=1 Tax=Candidatus Ryanbacteria bacterium RIFCSPLOWO2_02_FULL_47_14 TaxID=1802129 RepID=A0A1G2H3M2_9BACT|nr:MAG: triose-phosphate isomerase [Candidatus Ryanbacteria bacterium RIFCSPLOWO2_02_FULL_47_14]